MPAKEALLSLRPRRNVPPVLRSARRAVVLVFGATALLLGVAMLVLPGPGLLGILLGLSILGTEFAWARRLLRRARRAAGLDSPRTAAPRDDAPQGGTR